jgi:hypothetical protein
MSLTNPIRPISVPEVLSKLRDGEWLVPAFQREFVWDVPAIVALGTSIIDGYPIGMMTLWDQSEEDDASHLEGISLPDWDPAKKKVVQKHFSGKKGKQPKAILDGRQRCTALAMLFDNFRQEDKKKRYAGKFFLDVTAADPYERIIFVKTKRLESENLETLQAFISRGWFPLSPQNNKNITEQWLDYIEAVRNKANYPADNVPSDDELAARATILRNAYSGIFYSNVAVYTVPSDYDLGRICDIFETLNQTGVKVSTVDLIHTWILKESTIEGEPLAVREWMEEVSVLQGAVGWVSAEKRPELTAQIVTACYVARTDKPDLPRKSRGQRKEIRSVKSPDLLNTPKAHWRQIVANQTAFVALLEDFQKLVAGGLFSADKCPYPVSAAVYVALRWHLMKDYPNQNGPWSRPELDALYRAFFWWNALSGRYDQGFLTQLGTDISSLKSILQARSEYESSSAWIAYARVALAKLMEKDLPSAERLTVDLLSGRPGGALQSAVQLTMIAGCRHDIGGIDLQVGKPLDVHLHHIFPRKWCKSNANGKFEAILDPTKSELDYVNSVANTMPLSPVTNQEWRDMSPGTYIASRKISFQSVEDALKISFIDEQLFELLKQDLDGVESFWKLRASAIATHLIGLTDVKL